MAIAIRSLRTRCALLQRPARQLVISSSGLTRQSVDLLRTIVELSRAASPSQELHSADGAEAGLLTKIDLE